MKIIAIILIAGSFFALKYRERVSEMIGDPEWASSIGGVYNLILIGSIVMFFWGVAILTNTMDFLLEPIFGRFVGR